MAWLRKHGLYFIHSTFGRKATMTKDAPDFVILHRGKCLLVEIKTEKGAMTAGQTKKFAEIQRNSGMVVQIARSVEQSVSAVTAWLGIESAGIEAMALPSVPLENERAVESIAKEPTPDEGRKLFIGRVGDQQYVFEGSGKPGTPAKMIRTATLFDVRNIGEAGK